MKLLCQHTNIHRHMDSSQESNISSSGADTIVKQGNGPHTINLLKDFNFKWSRTGKRGSNRITSQDAQPLKLRVRPPHMETRKNKKMKTEDTKMEFELGGTKSESGVDPCHARRSRKNKAVKNFRNGSGSWWPQNLSSGEEELGGVIAAGQNQIRTLYDDPNAVASSISTA
ncbi:hypothetical protein GOBAR_DD36848 [Gossypium barbadense]|nr:hypothetical protein GOBAR_DD36848 [Gossypium barbadense]